MMFSVKVIDFAPITLGLAPASSLWGNTFAHARVNPGDTIVIPDRLFKGSPLRSFLQWSQVFSQAAIGAAAIRIIVP